jgi:hypothetical protein
MSRNIDVVKILQFVWIIGILAIAWGVEANKSQDLRCQLLMCSTFDDTVAVAATSNSSHLDAAQHFIASQCPEETDITECDISCDGPYNPYLKRSYWIWKDCQIDADDSNGIWDFICDTSVLDVCQQGEDPEYPFN